MSEVFYRLLCDKSRECTCSTNSSLCCNYSDEYLQNKLIIRHERPDRSLFYVFDDYEDFKLANLTPNCAHEIIFGDYTQRFKIDLDFPSETKGNTLRIARSISETMINVLKRMFVGELLDVEQIRACICYSKSPNKVGYHITISDSIFADSNITVNAFLANLVRELPPDISALIDKQTNKSLQNWRLVGCHKHNSVDRVKMLLDPINFGVNDAIITPGRNYNMPIILSAPIEKPQSQPSPVKVVDVPENKLIELCQAKMSPEELSSHIFHAITKKNVFFINFKRIKPSYCEFCKRIHDSDNTLYFIYAKQLYKKCRHHQKYPPSNSIK